MGESLPGLDIDNFHLMTQAFSNSSNIRRTQYLSLDDVEQLWCKGGDLAFVLKHSDNNFCHLHDDLPNFYIVVLEEIIPHLLKVSHALGKLPVFLAMV